MVNHCGFGIWDFGKKGLSISPVRSFKFCFKNKIAVVGTARVGPKGKKKKKKNK